MDRRAFLKETIDCLGNIPESQLTRMTNRLMRLRRDQGRLFLIGNGGGAGHASHAASDFRNIAQIESWAFDNMSELTAEINDRGWNKSVVSWLRRSHFEQKDGLFVFSVGGGGMLTSTNLTEAIKYAAEINEAAVLGVVGKHGGQAGFSSPDVLVLSSASTGIVEGVQAVVWHLLVEGLRV